MRTHIRMKNRHARRLPPEFRDSDLRYPDELVAFFVQRFSRPGDLVFDPFAGYGTTLIVAEAMGRAPLGVEYDAARAAYIRLQLHNPAAIICGDSRRLRDLPIPPVDLSITSPPFTERDDPENPFANYREPGGGYQAYLDQMRAIYAQVRDVLRPGARAVLEVANLKGPRGVTTLAWDVGRAVAEVLHFEGEIVIAWDTYAYGYDHSYCLIFQRPPNDESDSG